ncbi:VOC family protein [Paenibacillus paeoniae]|uniref:VOC family protein n=1 Tax=Paenibacillus paeoniae TaxID=2292705 RepID=A0A371PGM8_9BACL|nr:VOC family protein [Paenibacillus paeoniae]REK75101.1 VOC family protein [Paenibacillus paeoniae]
MTTFVLPPLYFDGSVVDVLWDNHEEAIRWYERFMMWEVGQQENWKPDPRCTHGKMTRLNWGTWLISSLSSVRLPHHFAERGTVESNIRLCWRTKNLKRLHSHYQSNGVRVTAIYKGPGHTSYFDFWATGEGIRFTAQEDKGIQEEGFVHSWIRIGVSNLSASVQWYCSYLGMEVENDSSQDGYAIMSLRLNHQPNHKSLWVLEQVTDDAYIGKVDGPVRPVCWVGDREAFFHYRTFLSESGIETSDVGGFLTRGLVSFHAYDPDGNRLNFSSM